MKFRCGCVWLGVRCPNEATAEDGMCDWCAPSSARTEEQLRENPNALIGPDGTFMGLGGSGMTHDAPLAALEGSDGPSACWYGDSGRVVAPPGLLAEDAP